MCTSSAPIRLAFSAQSADEIKALVAGLAKSALDKDVDITVATWEAWSKNAQ